MSKGYWRPEVIRPRTRCRFCGYVIKGKENIYRVDGYKPCHRDCAERRGLTVGKEIIPQEVQS